MSGYKVDGVDLDEIFQKKEDFTDTYRSTYKIYQYATDTSLNYNKVNDLRDRYISSSSSSPYNSTIGNTTGFTIGDGTDLNAIFSKKTSIIRYEVEMEGERGRSQQLGDLGWTELYNSGIPYGAHIKFNVWLDSSRQYKVEKCFGGNPGTDADSSNGIRIGGRGGHSLALMEKDTSTIIAVPGSGGGDGSGNSRRGASVFYRGMKNVAGMSKEDLIAPYYDVFKGGTPNYDYLRDIESDTNYYEKLEGSTIARFYNTNNTLYQVNSPKTFWYPIGRAPAAGYYYGLTAPFRNHWGGGGGYNEGGKGYRENTNGYKFTGGKGGDGDGQRRSASGGGGGAGMYGGGGGAETNTTNGYLGSPGGGSGSTYYNTADTYDIDIDNNIYPKPTKNTDASISIKNLNNNNIIQINFSDTDYTNTVYVTSEKIINLP